MISETCPGNKLGRTGKAPGEARVQKRVNRREPGRHAHTESEPKGWESESSGAQSLSSEVLRRPSSSESISPLPVLTRSVMIPLPASAWASSSDAGPDLLINQQLFYF